MKEFILTEQESERTVLVGLVTPQQNEAKVNEYLDELAFLADTAGAVPVKNFIQKLDYPNPVTFVGKGKLEEIRQYVEENEIGLVIFDDELSPEIQAIDAGIAITNDATNINPTNFLFINISPSLTFLNKYAANYYAFITRIFNLLKSC